MLPDPWWIHCVATDVRSGGMSPERTQAVSPVWVTPSEYMSSELLQIPDIVRSAFHYSANLLVLQITAFWVRAIPR